ncbi:AAA family ATPase [Acetobacter estunensis]|uniref:AAA family ATPase n=1 Tax=Acetobacter estunensis TaxID=104097 RepID=UPI001C2D7A15|nr:AAA family ATPase [Acetobacter estunensis]MBV1838211.1 AAA family ATPase [Acetobacter estunensis]
MSARFVQLRIAGFKSFADPVSVDILPGLTGIVGPNGCGKSNVVEGLRWAMGETSARNLRGGEMDDLIFAGTTSRPARNLAEVTLVLENAKGLGPGPFAEQDDLEITRRAERGSGSDYRLNGKATRGRDIQTLFADLASGARSSAMVSQGRVAMLVGARPEERRTILEEAAGITGLHARRHEAELKLRATEANLTRAEDLKTQLETRLQGLAGQSTQAAKYRELSANLREAETTLLALLHARARQQVERARLAAIAARNALIAAEEAAETAVLAEYEADRALPAIREAAEQRRTALERQRVAAEGIAREEEQAAQALEAASSRLKQSEADRDAALSRMEDAQATLTRLGEEVAAIETVRTTLPARQEEADATITRLRTELAQAGDALERATADVSAARTRTEQARAALEATSLRHDRLTQARGALEAELTQLHAEMPDDAALKAAEDTVRQANEHLSACRVDMETATQRKSDAHLALSIAQNAAEAARTRHAERAKAHATAKDTLAALTRDRDALMARQAEAQRGLVPETERAALAAALAQAEAAQTEAARALEAAETERAAAASALLEARARVQEDSTLRAAASETVRRAEAALKRAEQEAGSLAKELETAQRDAVPDSVLEQAQTARAKEEHRLQDAETALTQAEETLTRATGATRECEAALGTLNAELTQLRARIDGLAQALGGEEPEDTAQGATPVSDLLRIPAGLEMAVAAVLADGLDAPEASASPAAPRAWLALGAWPTSPALPAGACALSDMVESAPDTLRRALSQSGLIEDTADGDALARSLQPGQSLVTREGALWRWDGYRIAAGQPNAAAQRLTQRRILLESRTHLAELEDRLPEAETRARTALQAQTESEAAMRQARELRATIETALGQARTHEAETARRHGAARARLDAVRPQHERAAQALDAARISLTEAQAAQEALPDPAALKQAYDAARTRDQNAQQTETAAREARRRTTQALEQAQRARQATESCHTSAETKLATITPDLARFETDCATAAKALETAQAALDETADPAAVTNHLQAAQTEATESTQAETRARSACAEAEQTLTATAEASRILQTRALELRSQLSALLPRRDSLDEELADATTALEAARQAVTAATIDPEQEALPETLRARIAALRADEQAAGETRAALLAERETLSSRENALKAALAEWTERESVARTQLAQAEQRLAGVAEEHRTVATRPEEALRLRTTTLAALDDAEKAYQEANAAREAAEVRLKDAQESRRQTETALTQARETVVRSEGKNEQAQAILAQLLAETPEPPLAPVGDLTESAETGLRRRISRLTREREELGPVNLRADLEAQEAEQQIETIRREHAELEAAIARLRGSIGSLNKEGRERLMAVFTQVDHHFQSLFSRMFGGGRAHLGLVGSDDPLQAGLEIYAQPPGKKLATLSLLSGGEQALTALSLIFAVFRCNPAPICVLDEVDAPLDDANVGRFCALLGDMANEGGTRFLVVTHHQLTMAHMDRLYGVTMQERGVSRVLSVDLERAAAMAGAGKKEDAHV